MRLSILVAIILLVAPVSAVCEGEKAEYERAYSEYNANPTKGDT
jgi:hypothetical protein